LKLTTSCSDFICSLHSLSRSDSHQIFGIWLGEWCNSTFVAVPTLASGRDGYCL
jgi:hypothetical protein